MINIGKFTTFQTKNLAKNFLNIEETNDINKFLDICEDEYYVIGGGSNILLSQKEYPNKVFIKNSMEGIENLGGGYIKVKAGHNLMAFIDWVVKELKLDYLNPTYGIPGSVGGAVIVGAESRGVKVGNYVESVNYYDEKGKFIENGKYESLYRNSNLKNRKILLTEIIFKLDKSGYKRLESSKYYAMRENNGILPCSYYTGLRNERYEPEKTCGCYFKNQLIINDGTNDSIIEKIMKYPESPILKIYGKDLYKTKEFLAFSSWMLEMSNVKGMDLNGVKVSDKHSNFILNYDNENPANILIMADIMKEKVYDKFGVSLDPEVRIV